MSLDDQNTSVFVRVVSELAPQSVTLARQLKVSNIALDTRNEIKDKWVTVFANNNGFELLLGTLSRNVLQLNLDQVFDQGDLVLEVSGPGSVYVMGNYLEPNKSKLSTGGYASSETTEAEGMIDKKVDLQEQPANKKSRIDPVSYLKNGVTYTDLEPGYGRAAKAGDRLIVDWSGKLKGDDKRSFSDEKIRKKINLSGSNLIDGLKFGIEGMRAGGKRRLEIPAALGFVTDPLLAGKDLLYDVTVREICGM